MINTKIQDSRFTISNSTFTPCTLHLLPCILKERGFTLVEMIMVIVITGIIGGMVAVFLKAPVQQYMDLSRRADMTDIADTALRRIERDVRLALPNSVRVTTVGSNTYLEFLPTTGGGRYRAAADPAPTATGCGSSAANVLDFTVADTCFEVLGAMPPAFTGGESVVVYNLGISGASVYDNSSRTTTAVAQTGSTITIGAPGKLFPFDSPSHRFQVITAPVTYVCNAPATNAAGNGTGTLIRWQGYAIQSAQPTTLPATGTPSSSLLATNVSNCNFVYDANVVAQRSGLVTINLGITENNETVTLYSAAHVSNEP
jgi:MSHA biogenesis protein MshO